MTIIQYKKLAKYINHYEDDRLSVRCSKILVCYVMFLQSIICLFVLLLLHYHNNSSVHRNESQEIFAHPPPNVGECRLVPIDQRFDCFPDDINVSPETCNARGCCWDPVHPEVAPGVNKHKKQKVYTPEIPRSEEGTPRPPLNVPYCYYPKDYLIYNFTNVKHYDEGIFANLEQVFQSGFPNDSSKLQFEIIFETCSRLHIVMYDLRNGRMRTPIPGIPPGRVVEGCGGKRKYDVEIVEFDGTFYVARNDSGTVLVDSRGAAPLIFSEQFLQFSSSLPSPFIYGLGQHLDGLLLDVYWKRRVLWNADMWPEPEKNLYGSHPFYMVMEETGKAHGVLLLNSNAMDIVLQPTPAATFHVTGGMLDLYVFLGPTPDEVMTQYSDVIGRPFLPPYWSLGYHQCRFGYENLTKTKEVLRRTQKAGIPIDVQWNDIDYMVNQNDFTFDDKRFAGLPEFVKQLHEDGLHYVIITDPGISAGEAPGTYPPYDNGLKYDIFVKNSSNHLFIGKVWNPKATVWPDFTHPKAVDYWKELIEDFHERVPFDGLWIDMNEPSNFWDGQKDGCPNSTLEDPPYLPPVVGGWLRHRTLCMTAKHYLGLHYDVHNIYGFMEAIVTHRSLKAMEPKKRPFIISRASFPGLGSYSGHWTGDVHSDWFNLWRSIGDMLTFNLLGIPMVGADICGFNGNTTRPLCNRWMQLGAFYPFARNHNTDDGIEQDPVAMGAQVIKSSKKALTQRYTLLPYLYTLFVTAHLFGSPVAQPLFFNFPTDTETYAIDTQFMWGQALMIVPVLEEGAESVRGYFPAGKWYDFDSGRLIVGPEAGGEYVVLPAPLDTIPLAVRGGYIIPCQTPGFTTTQSRRGLFGLVAALNSEGRAEGILFWDDGESLDSYESRNYIRWKFRIEANGLHSYAEVQQWLPLQPPLILGWIRIFGVEHSISEVKINGRPNNFSYNATAKVLVLDALELPFTDNYDISWKTS